MKFAVAAATFCTLWDTGTPATKEQFLMDRLPKVAAAIQNKGASTGYVAEFVICYQRNINKLRFSLDGDCQVEKALTKFFNGVQVDTSDREFSDIANYINACQGTR